MLCPKVYAEKQCDGSEIAAGLMGWACDPLTRNSYEAGEEKFPTDARAACVLEGTMKPILYLFKSYIEFRIRSRKSNVNDLSRQGLSNQISLDSPALRWGVAAHDQMSGCGITSQ